MFSRKGVKKKIFFLNFAVKNDICSVSVQSSPFKRIQNYTSTPWTHHTSPHIDLVTPLVDTIATPILKQMYCSCDNDIRPPNWEGGCDIFAGGIGGGDRRGQATEAGTGGDRGARRGFLWCGVVKSNQKAPAKNLPKRPHYSLTVSFSAFMYPRD